MAAVSREQQWRFNAEVMLCNNVADVYAKELDTLQMASENFNRL